jgi:multisubunit Na+/H+ antiporter MnhB subunit
MENNQESSDRSAIDNVSFGIVIFGLLLGIAGVILVTPGVAVTGLVVIGFGLSYFGLRQMLAR